MEYNRRDVEVELAIHDRLSLFPMPEAEWDAYALDQRINDTGILLDRTLADAAVVLDDQHREETLARALGLTGLENPNSPIQLKEWLTTHDCHLESLAKADVEAALDTATGKVKEVLELRGELAKSSVKKYQAMHNVAGADGRARSLIQFYGAGRTGRFAGRLVQVQNLPRNYLPDLHQARTLTRQRNLDAFELLYDSVPDTLSQLIRTAFIPSAGCRRVRMRLLPQRLRMSFTAFDVSDRGVCGRKRKFRKRQGTRPIFPVIPAACGVRVDCENVRECRSAGS